MTDRRDEWWRLAACHNHPFLNAEAWFDVEAGVPRDQGARALIVCRFSCPVREKCREKYQGVDAIAGGGWFDGNGTFHDLGNDVMDIYQAAAYVGVPTERFRQMVHKKLKPAFYRNGRNWYRVEDIMKLTITRPAHGTYGAQEVHILRGEPYCEQCQFLADLVNRPMGAVLELENVEGVSV